MAAPAPPFQPGDVLPGTKYTVVQKLGVGGMGVVYQVKKPPEIQCVLKLMSPELAGDREFRTRFFDEVRVLAQIEHPNIVRVFDYDTLTDGTPFYVMELLHGRTVRDVLAAMGTVPPRVAFEITRQLLEALHCAHTNDVAVVHRDIKPENIFLHSPKHGEPTVKLIDFGVVAFSDHTHDDTFVGTPSYAAPEQVRGERATPATDLYAVGLVLYEMLCGRGPFDHHASATLVSLAHLREQPAPVTNFAPWVPPSVVALIASALAKDPRARPRDAYAFIERLYDLQWADDGSHPPPPTSEGPLHSMLGAPRPAAASDALTADAARPAVGHQPAKIRRETLRGLDGGAFTQPPREETLLEGLDRRSDPGISRPRQLPRSSPALRPRLSSTDADTLGSQTSDTNVALRRRKRGIRALVGTALALATTLALVATWKAVKPSSRVAEEKAAIGSGDGVPSAAPSPGGVDVASAAASSSGPAPIHDGGEPPTVLRASPSSTERPVTVSVDAGRADKPASTTKKPAAAPVNTSFAREL